MQEILLISMPGATEWILIILLVFVWIGAIINVATSDFQTPNTKVTWLLITILLGVLGGLLYWTIGRSYRVKNAAGR
jgi:uncharacterized integral membrane protein